MIKPVSDSAKLEALRRRIDAVDDRLHDLLLERAGIVAEVTGQKRADGVPPFRPGREAQILRRLVQRHRGAFPASALVRIWREILGGSVALQAELAVVLSPGCRELARDHFGIAAQMVDAPSADEVVIAVREGSAAVGVLPLADDHGRTPWWLALADFPASERPRVIARIPFGACSDSAAVRDAVVIAASEPEPSGDDCTLYAVTASGALATARITDALLAAGLDGAPLAESMRRGGAAALLEVGGFLKMSDGKIGAALGSLARGLKAAWLGAYARPLPDALLGGIAPE